MTVKHPIFFDLYAKLQTDSAFRRATSELLTKIGIADRSKDTMSLIQLRSKLIRLCEFNPSLLMSFFYPDFLDGEAMRLWTRPHAFAMMAMVPNGSITIAASRQIGKCVAGDTEVTVCVGDEESKKTTCKELFSMARKKIACTHGNK